MAKNNQSTPIYILKIVYPLIVICAVIALLVAAVNTLTAPVIENMAQEERNTSIRTLFDNENASIDEEAIYEIPEEHTKVIDKISKVVEISEEVTHLGYCIQLSPNGFKGEVDLLVAFDTKGLVIGVDVTSTNDETKGFGTKVNEPSYEGLFAENENKKLPENATKDLIIAGATKTSKPVAQSILTAKAVLSQILSTELVENGVADEAEISEQEAAQ